MIGMIAATLSHGFIFSGIPSRLMFHFRIDFRTEEDNECRKKEPQHKSNHCSEAAISFIKSAKVIYKKAKEQRTCKPEYGSYNSSPTSPFKCRTFTIGCTFINRS